MAEKGKEHFFGEVINGDILLFSTFFVLSIRRDVRRAKYLFTERGVKTFYLLFVFFQSSLSRIAFLYQKCPFVIYYKEKLTYPYLG